jgi:hypothetical protein
MYKKTQNIPIKQILIPQKQPNPAGKSNRNAVGRIKQGR